MPGANGKNVVLSPLAFLAQEVLLLGPLTAPVWIAGLWAFGVKPKLAPYRAFAVSWVVVVALVVLTHGKGYYAAPIYPILFAGGAVWAKTTVRSRAAHAVYASLLGAVSLLLSPITVPLLPVTTFISYGRLLHMAPSQGASERLAVGLLPQYYADMFGWREMTAKVAAIYHALPPEDRARAVFFGRNYGEAAAVDVFGPPLGLPPAISGHNSYFLWGPMGHDASVVITLGGERSQFLQAYKEVTVAGRLDDPYAMLYETNIPIYVLRGLKVPFDWARLKHYE